MKTSRYSDSQIMAMLKQAEASLPLPKLLREHVMSITSFLTGGQIWRYGRLSHDANERA